MTCKKYNLNVIMTYRNICFGRSSIAETVTVTIVIYVVFLVLRLIVPKINPVLGF